MSALLIVIVLAAALVLAAVDELRAQGHALTSWAVILIAAVLLWGKLG